jgi:hypothetical protein
MPHKSYKEAQKARETPSAKRLKKANEAYQRALVESLYRPKEPKIPAPPKLPQ